MNTERHIAALLLNHLNGTITDSERAALDLWVSASASNKLLYEEITNETLLAEDVEKLHPDNWEEIARRMKGVIFNSTQPVVSMHLPQKRRVFQYWGWVAASVLVVLSVAVFFIANYSGSKEQQVVNATFDSAPGKTGAILTLADGTQVLLDSMKNGVVAAQMGANVVLIDGRLAYDPTGDLLGESGYNTMVTPNGRQFHIVLQDGTQVWLNAASSIRYPTMFTGSERKVQISGEVYMEVAKNAKQPFIVQVDDGQEIKVLGTSFNVNAYKDDKGVVTTLIEGSINVRKDNQQVILKPLQQLTIDSTSGDIKFIVKDKKDLGNVVAWRNGLFNFEGATLQNLMKQIGRWYDVEVVFEKGVPKLEFGGELDKNVPLSVVLKALEKNGIKFRFEDGRRLVVLP